MSSKNANYADDLRDRLRDPEYAAEYLNAVLADDSEGVEAVFLLALRDIAEAVQMSKVAGRAGVNRENLYRMLSGKGNPRFRSLLAVLNVIGLRLSIAPSEPSGPEPGVIKDSTETTLQSEGAEERLPLGWVERPAENLSSAGSQMKVPFGATAPAIRFAQPELTHPELNLLVSTGGSTRYSGQFAYSA